MSFASLSSPVGPLTVWEEDGEIVALDWRKRDAPAATPALTQAVAQLQAYFARELEVFDLPLRLGVTAFQKAFSQALLDIPFGHTRTYGELSKDLGVSAQAIGQACGGNKIPIIIPCHRVLGATGLGGFSGRDGVEAKVELLKHEGAASLLI